MSSGFVTSAVWLLRCALVVQCLGQASLYVFDTFRIDSPMYGLLVHRLGWTGTAAEHFDKWAHITAFVASCVALALPLLLLLIGRSSTKSWDRWPRTAWQLPLVGGLALWHIALLIGDALSARSALHVVAYRSTEYKL